MYKKRGQVTLLVALGIVLVIVIALLFFLFSDYNMGPKITDSEIEDVNSYVESCLRSLLDENAPIANDPDCSDYENYQNSYSKKLGEAMSIYVQSNFLSKCQIDSNFDNLDITVGNVKVTDVKVDLKIDNDMNDGTCPVLDNPPYFYGAQVKSYNIQINLPLTIKKGSDETKLETFSARYTDKDI